MLRHKIITLHLDIIIKYDLELYGRKLNEIAHSESLLFHRMFEYLLSDLIFLQEETIDKYNKIKEYQDFTIHEDYKNLNQEEKNIEYQKFFENDRFLRSVIKVIFK